MLPLENIFAFLIVAIAITFAPGPDNLMVLGQSLARGRMAGFGIAVGCALGCFTHTLWALLGVSAAIASSPELFYVLKLAGAAYLCWLGIQILRHANTIKLTTDKTHQPLPWFHYLRRGFIANAINPKVALFFLALLPQFTTSTQGSIPLQMLQLGLVFALQTIIVFGLVAFMAGSIGHYLSHHGRAAVWLDRIAGFIFIALALRLIFDRHPA